MLLNDLSQQLDVKQKGQKTEALKHPLLQEPEWNLP